jgi:hypothetical protein
MTATLPRHRRALPETRQVADFWFDPLCPWAWLSSRWMYEVQQVRAVDVHFHLMSLYFLNQDRDISEDYRARIQAGRHIGRVVAAASRFGPKAVPTLYTELGRRFHNEGLERDQETVLAALTAAELPTDLIEAWNDESLDVEVRGSHERGMDLVGLDVGTPVISVAGTAFFGPVVTPAPTGEDAGRLWDGVLLVASTPGFYELKRTRDERPRFDIGAAALHS